MAIASKKFEIEPKQPSSSEVLLELARKVKRKRALQENPQAPIEPLPERKEPEKLNFLELARARKLKMQQEKLQPK